MTCFIGECFFGVYTFSLDFLVAATTKFHIKILKHCVLSISIWGQLIQSKHASKGVGNFSKIGLWLIPKNFQGVKKTDILRSS